MIKNKQLSLLVFQIAGQLYGFDLSFTDAVVPIMKIRKIPKLPAFISGIIEIRGTVIPVIDLGIFLGNCRESFSSSNRIILVIIEGIHVGLIVDAALQVIEPEEEQIKASVISKETSSCLDYMVQVGDALIQSIDIDKLFTPDELQSFSRIKK